MMLNGPDILFRIIGGIEDLSEADSFVPAIHDRHDDRYPGASGNVIETSFPFHHLVACPFRGNGQDEFFGLVEHLHHLIHHSRGSLAVYRDPAEVKKEPSKRKAKCFSLGHEVDIRPHAEHDSQEEHEIPIGGVRCTD